MVCRIYKALFAFALLGFVSTIGALLLDVYVFRRSVARGQYNQMDDLDSKHNKTMPGYRDASGSNPLPVSYDDMNNNDDIEFKDQPARPKNTAGGDYQQPEEQFSYDTGYHGAHNERL